MSPQIVQIVPRLAPSVGGVADYASLLAQRLTEDCQIDSSFLVGDPAWQGPARLDRFSVDRIDGQQAHQLERQLIKLGADLVLLHYVGYGYQKRGCPIWLVSGLKSWKTKYPRRRLVVMFHELFAYGRPWQSSFWTSPLQRILAKSLALLSDHCVTNLTGSAQALAAMTGRPQSAFTVLPVFSNVGELAAPRPWRQRKSHMIVFGSAAWRRQAYLEYGNDLARACRTLDIDTIVDLGPPCGELPKLPFAHVIEGVLAAESVDRQLAEARAGFFTCPAPYLGKSGIFAAYAAHGLLPVTFSANGAVNRDGLAAGTHFLPSIDSTGNAQERFSAIARRAHSWYSDHRIANQARRYSDCLLNAASRTATETDLVPTLLSERIN